MTISISVGSGKGGTGKSTVVANLALLLARAGRKVCVVDLDLGGADSHILFGLFEPQRTLTDFLSRKVDSIADIVHTFEPFYNLQLIAGTGDTLQSANMTFQEKQRLLRGLAEIDTDILLFDVGAGTSYHVLDFFMHADIQMCVACPEPTSIMDFYKFLQLATIRKALGSFLARGEVSKTLKDRNFQSLKEVFDLAEEIKPGSRQATQKALETFHPLLIINRAGLNAKLNHLKLRKLAAKYLGIYLPDLGEIPEDPAVMAALRAYLPVCEYAPDSPAAKALETIAVKVGKVVDLFTSKRGRNDPTG